MDEIEKLADSVFKSVKGYLAASLAGLVSRLDGFEKRLSELPTPKDGKDGQRGLQGEKGIDGANGKDGERGPDGKDGKDGANGKDAVIDKEALIQEILALIPKPKDGAAGKDGKDGADAVVDKAAIVAEVVSLVPKAKDGIDGARGKDGVDGQDGQDGKSGNDGRDALDIDPIPQIDSERSYPAGTWAKCRGGLVRASRNTEPLSSGQSMPVCGWEMMVEGLYNLEVRQSDDLRTFIVLATNSAGEFTTVQATLPVMMHRGVWVEKEYAIGDVVTWGGSQWHCDEDQTKAKPGTPGSSAWRLIVKRGQDGKDGEKGDRGERGLPGESKK